MTNPLSVMGPSFKTIMHKFTETKTLQTGLNTTELHCKTDSHYHYILLKKNKNCFA